MAEQMYQQKVRLTCVKGSGAWEIEAMPEPKHPGAVTDRNECL